MTWCTIGNMSLLLCSSTKIDTSSNLGMPKECLYHEINMVVVMISLLVIRIVPRLHFKNKQVDKYTSPSLNCQKDINKRHLQTLHGQLHLFLFKICFPQKKLATSRICSVFIIHPTLSTDTQASSQVPAFLPLEQRLVALRHLHHAFWASHPQLTTLEVTLGF